MDKTKFFLKDYGFLIKKKDVFENDKFIIDICINSIESNTTFSDNQTQKHLKIKDFIQLKNLFEIEDLIIKLNQFSAQHINSGPSIGDALTETTDLKKRPSYHKQPAQNQNQQQNESSLNLENLVNLESHDKPSDIFFNDSLCQDNTNGSKKLKLNSCSTNIANNGNICGKDSAFNRNPDEISLGSLQNGDINSKVPSRKASSSKISKNQKTITTRFNEDDVSNQNNFQPDEIECSQSCEGDEKNFYDFSNNEQSGTDPKQRELLLQSGSSNKKFAKQKVCGNESELLKGLSSTNSPTKVDLNSNGGSDNIRKTKPHKRKLIFDGNILEPANNKINLGNKDKKADAVKGNVNEDNFIDIIENDPEEIHEDKQIKEINIFDDTGNGGSSIAGDKNMQQMTVDESGELVIKNCVSGKGLQNINVTGGTVSDKDGGIREQDTIEITGEIVQQKQPISQKSIVLNSNNKQSKKKQKVLSKGKITDSDFSLEDLNRFLDEEKQNYQSRVDYTSNVEDITEENFDQQIKQAQHSNPTNSNNANDNNGSNQKPNHKNPHKIITTNANSIQKQSLEDSCDMVETVDEETKNHFLKRTQEGPYAQMAMDANKIDKQFIKPKVKTQTQDSRKGGAYTSPAFAKDRPSSKNLLNSVNTGGDGLARGLNEESRITTDHENNQQIQSDIDSIENAFPDFLVAEKQDVVTNSEKEKDMKSGKISKHNKKKEKEIPNKKVCRKSHLGNNAPNLQSSNTLSVDEVIDDDDDQEESIVVDGLGKGGSTGKDYEEVEIDVKRSGFQDKQQQLLQTSSSSTLLVSGNFERKKKSFVPYLTSRELSPMIQKPHYNDSKKQQLQANSPKIFEKNKLQPQNSKEKAQSKIQEDAEIEDIKNQATLNFRSHIQPNTKPVDIKDQDSKLTNTTTGSTSLIGHNYPNKPELKIKTEPGLSTSTCKNIQDRFDTVSKKIKKRSNRSSFIMNFSTTSSHNQQGQHIKKEPMDKPSVKKHEYDNKNSVQYIDTSPTNSACQNQNQTHQQNQSRSKASSTPPNHSPVTSNLIMGITNDTTSNRYQQNSSYQRQGNHQQQVELNDTDQKSKYFFR